MYKKYRRVAAMVIISCSYIGLEKERKHPEKYVRNCQIVHGKEGPICILFHLIGSYQMERHLQISLVCHVMNESFCNTLE